MSEQGKQGQTAEETPDREAGWPDHVAADAIQLLGEVAWGDVVLHVKTVKAALRLAVEATEDGFALWETGAEGERRYGDEFSVGPEAVRKMDSRWRMAYVARLVASADLVYGDSDDRHSPAGLLHDLIELDRASRTAAMTPRYSEEHLISRRRERAAVARRIDPRTAHATWTYQQTVDPYEDFMVAGEADQIGRRTWLFDPDDRFFITEDDVRRLHPDFSHLEWERIMRAAFARSREASRDPEDPPRQGLPSD